MNKGFTLMELVASIVILSIISLLAFPAILNVLNKSNEEVNDSLKKTIISSAESYVNDHKNNFKKPVEGEKDIITEIEITKLLEEGYIDSTVYEKYCEINNDKIIVISNFKKYTYKYSSNNDDENCKK